MVIFMDEDGRLTLREADDFQRFEVEVASSLLDSRRVAAALASLGEPAEGGYVWIDEGRLVTLAGRQDDREWLANFAAMKEKVRRFGWIDDGRRTIRAHIRYSAITPS